ncbi:MAG: hypothetical protein DWQ08_02815 [Proteobacteria bacterium]|nr:MAG: hypothetical protein DWQ08_02815 [Pseudomonadota bacterium]
MDVFHRPFGVWDARSEQSALIAVVFARATLTCSIAVHYRRVIRIERISLLSGVPLESNE